VRLSELEEVFRDEGVEDVPPTPKRHNESRTAESNQATKKDPTYADARAAFLGMKLPWS